MDKVVPHDLQAEASALGAMILNGDKLDNAMSRLKGSDFFRPAHSAIFHAIMQLHTDGKPIDLVTLKSQLVKNKAYEKVGGQDYLVELCEGCPSISSLDHYVDVVMEKSTTRQLITGCDRLENKAYGEAFDVREQTNKLIEWGVKLNKRLNPKQRGHSCDISELIEDVIEDSQKPPRGVPTGFKDIDDHIYCLEDGCIYILAAYTGGGKSALAASIAMNVSQHGRVAFFSAEMAGLQITRRIVCGESGVLLARAKKGLVTDEETKRMRDMSAKYKGRIQLVYGALNTDMIESEMDQMEGTGSCSDPIKLVVVDYIQLMKGEGRDMRERISNISNDLKQIAMKRDVPILVLSQFRRPPTEGYHQPVLTQLKESGSLEQDADCVILLNAPEEDVLEKTVVDKTALWYGDRHVKIAKSRDGIVTPWYNGTEGIRLKWFPGITRFGDWQ